MHFYFSFSSPSLSHHFSSHCSIHLWSPVQVCWTLTVSCFLSRLSASSQRSSLLSPPPFLSTLILPLICSFGLFSVRLLNLRLLHRPPPSSPPHSTLSSFFSPLPCSPSLALSTLFLSPPLCHPSIKTPTDGPEPSAQATFCPSFFSPALHAKRRPIKVRLVSFFHSVVLLSVCLHSDSLGSLIKTLYFLFSLLCFFFFHLFIQLFSSFGFLIHFFFHLSALTHLNSSLFISLPLSSSGPRLMSLHHSRCFPPFVTHLSPHALLLLSSCFVFSCCYSHKTL